MAVAVCSTRQRLSEVNTNGANSFIEKLLYQIYENFDEQELVDVTFKLSNPTALVTAHRLILSAASPYFKYLFKSERGICPLIEITNIDSDTFERLVVFCYTGKAIITIDNVGLMLKAALILQMEDAITIAVDFLMERITDYKLERAYVLEREIQCALLSEKLLEYEIGNFMSITKGPEFLNFDASKLKTLLERDDLNITSEKDVFETVKLWYEHDASARKQVLPDLVACIRLTQFDTNFLLTRIRPLPGCEVVALKTVTWIDYPMSRSTLSIKYPKPRRGYNLISEESLLAIETCDGQSRTIFQYNKTENLWQKWIDIQIDANDFRVVFMNDNLIFTGGSRCGLQINEVSSWNFKTKIFQMLPAMNQSRDDHCVVSLNDNIYAIGGWASGKGLTSVEMYSVSNGWKEIKNMITPRYNAGAVVLNAKIYVMGGVNKISLKSVECYDPTTNCWTQCADMNEARSGAPGATVRNGQIFVVGGFNGVRCIKTVERYDPQRDVWTKICSLSIGMKFVNCISFDNQLWVIGGYDGRINKNINNDGRECINYISVYDESNDKWLDKKFMPVAGYYYCFSVRKVLLQTE
ncbi:kelch-like protein 5 [Eurosta solidaginis]|uniref:kelch-like protein 5 n=1 Tax=Eurosta solidaginis TaxID=178769 RepID=UPI0035312F4C